MSECYSPYAQTGCPEDCSYASGKEEHRDHSHWRCEGHGHTWVYFPQTGVIDWLDLSQPARLIYPVYAARGTRRKR